MEGLTIAVTLLKGNSFYSGYLYQEKHMDFYLM